MSKQEKELANIFNDYFGDVTGDLPGYEKAIQAYCKRQVIEELENLKHCYTLKRKSGKPIEYYGLDADTLAERIKELKEVK